MTCEKNRCKRKLEHQIITPLEYRKMSNEIGAAFSAKYAVALREVMEELRRTGKAKNAEAKYDSKFPSIEDFSDSDDSDEFDPRKMKERQMSMRNRGRNRAITVGSPREKFNRRRTSISYRISLNLTSSDDSSGFIHET
mmetsp:Transcript_16365/g.24654  ORF Transcript_16365/g.24654 Transcript_16365/m.24654 type:complete len:139 (+) Transcript_16365:756-1172(+)|eukprot:CAMPEP_0167768756 /NCGR_PEP_ID=MMETSP0110_2-20121227/16865_1 /TAXON_ID=629695 /ORGANISM="Gymnochlora sp., Strain CCMP2014" /LENGTH=138 /DNA_ID=CAMNT_0007657507 /DNA_START=712 /DNA_END=1128 /DNA_ORIENTATION=-